MANSYTDKYKKRQPAAGDLNWDDELNQNQTIDDVLGAARDQNNRTIWGLAASDGGGLTVDYAAGRAEVAGSVFDIAASSKTAVDDASERSVNWLYVDSAGVVQIVQSAPTGDYAPIAMIDVASGAIDRIGDFRQQPSGLLADETLTEINKIIDTTANVVDVFLYDTSLDSDGGAWRERTEHTSWYQETLDTATRGSTRKFPAVALIVAETDTVTIYDATDVQLPMWMVFNTDSANGVLQGSANTSTISAIEGILIIGNDDASGFLISVYFVNDSDNFKTTSHDRQYSGGLVFRNGPSARGYVDLGNNIVNRTVNDVAITVLPDALIDQSTGLPVPTIAVATDGGMSVITDGGDIWDITTAGGFDAISFANNRLLSMREVSGPITYFGGIPTADIADTAYRVLSDTTYINSGGFGDIDIPDDDNLTAVAISQSLIAVGYAPNAGDGGLRLFQIDQNSPANSMVNNITKDYQSGWMQNDIRRAFLANSKTADRSVKGATLVETGTVTEAAVATGAELKKYSGFSVANYLTEAYSADLDFGTSDFHIMGWLKGTDTTGILLQRHEGATDTKRITVDVNSSLVRFYFESGTGITSSTSLATTDTWLFVVASRVSGTLSLYINGLQEGTPGSSSLNLTSTIATLGIGCHGDTTNNYADSLALWRIGAGAPSTKQVKYIYDTEKHLFQENADCTLSGTSDAVAALAHDDVNDLLYVGTGDGVSVFSGLQRVDYIDTTGISTSDAVNSLSASGGAYMIGNAAEAVGYIPAANLREEIVRQEQAGEVLEIHWGVGDTSETDFVMPAGYKPKFVYENGLIQKEGSGDDYTVAFDGFLYTVVFGAAPAAVNLGFMIVRA